MARKQTTIKQVIEVSTTWQEAVQGFLFWKQAQGKSLTAINDYRQHLQKGSLTATLTVGNLHN
ncbi:hypothetical protein JCM14036_31000 [Desulfotomaculum defluvii]